MKLETAFFNNVRSLIHSARATIARGVDLVQVHTCFEIGRRIVEQEQKGKGRARYGEQFLKSLAERLTVEFGRGFSFSNLKTMRQFYLQYQGRMGQSLTGQLVRKKLMFGPFGPASDVPPNARGKNWDAAKSQSLAGQRSADRPPRPFYLSWTHYVFLLTIQNPDERSFYEIESAAENWTVRQLKRQYDSSLYERLALSRDKAGIRKLAREGQRIVKSGDVLKNPLVLEFLDLHERHRYSESDLEAAIINRIERFLLELGKGFMPARRNSTSATSPSTTVNASTRPCAPTPRLCPLPLPLNIARSAKPWKLLRQTVKVALKNVEVEAQNRVSCNPITPKMLFLTQKQGFYQTPPKTVHVAHKKRGNGPSKTLSASPKPHLRNFVFPPTLHIMSSPQPRPSRSTP